MTNTLRPGESRRAHVTLAGDCAAGATPAGDLLRQIIAVEEVCPPGAAYAPPPLEWLTFFLTLQGHAHLHIGPHTLSHQPGALIALPSGSEIRERVQSRHPWHVRYLLLTGPWADQMSARLRRRTPAALEWAPAAPRPRQLLFEMAGLAMTQPPGWPWPFLSRCAELWGVLYSDAPPASPGDALVPRVCRLLDEMPAERPTVAEMAARLRLTPRQLIYRFRQESDEPLARWVRRHRVEAAGRLLRQGCSVTDVAARLGFANPYHFSRAFTAVTGVAPSTVRGDARWEGPHARADGEAAP